MCWMTKRTPVERIAEEDIPVFKYVCSDSLYSYYFPKHKYIMGETSHTTLGNPFPIIGLRGTLGVGDGFHSYGMACNIQEFDVYLKVYPPCGSYHIGYYTLYKLRRIECIIPKGSHYYVNDDLEYVSNKIIVNRISKVYNFL